MANEKDTAAFTSYLGQLQNGTLINHGIGLGANLGLFDVIGNIGKPATCDEIATAGNFKERYVREWLGLMTVGKIIDYDTDTKTFSIPANRLPYLTKNGKEKNAAVFQTGISICVGVQKELEECFKIDGSRGVPYSSYPGFHDWRGARVETLFQWHVIEGIFDKVPNLLKQLDEGISLCDAGCSAGHQILRLAEHFPRSTFLGFDIDQEVMDQANATAKERGLKNVTFVYQDGCDMPENWSNKYDVVTVWDVVHDVPHSSQFVKEIERVLKPGGLFFMMDIMTSGDLKQNCKIPFSPTFYGLSLFHCMPVSLFHEGGEGLGTCWGIKKQEEYLKAAGFIKIQFLDVGAGSNSYFIGYKKS